MLESNKLGDQREHNAFAVEQENVKDVPSCFGVACLEVVDEHGEHCLAKQRVKVDQHAIVYQPVVDHGKSPHHEVRQELGMRPAFGQRLVVHQSVLQVFGYVDEDEKGQALVELHQVPARLLVHLTQRSLGHFENPAHHGVHSLRVTDFLVVVVKGYQDVEQMVVAFLVWHLVVDVVRLSPVQISLNVAQSSVVFFALRLFVELIQLLG